MSRKVLVLSENKQLMEPPIKLVLWELWGGLSSALSRLPLLERGFHILWLLGPLIFLIERSPADIWLSLLGVAFVVRSVLKREGKWLRVFWVKACFLFLAVCVLSSAVSTMPYYALSETIIWFRFPLFAMATAFWLGTDKRLLYAMLISTALGMFVMIGILTAEMIIEGQKGGRLSWPYDDLVPGNYLSKVGLPAFAIMVALAVGAKPRLAAIMSGLSLISIILSIFTGERINFLIRACGGMLAALAWKPNWRRYAALIIIEVCAVLAVFVINPSMHTRYVDSFINQLPTGSHSTYYNTIVTGPKVAGEALFLGLGPATYRDICPKVLNSPDKEYCSNHPHNFYVQLITETGIIGLASGSFMFACIILAAFRGWRKNRDNVVAATAFVIPIAFFFPIQTTADFFGQWNNIFMWSSVALALAAATTLTTEQKK